MAPDPAAFAALILYLATAWPAYIAIGGRWRWGLPVETATLAPVTLALLAHLASLGPALSAPEGIAVGFGNAVSLFAWVVAATLAFLLTRWPLSHLGLVVWPVAALAVLAPMLAGPQANLALSWDWRVSTHVGLSLLAYALLSLGALQALVYALQDHRLHHPTGSLGRVLRLPALERMELMLFAILAAGWSALTLAILMGLGFVQDLFAQHLVHKTVLSLFAWLLFGILLLGRWRWGWRGRRAVQLTLTGFALLVLAYFGSKFVLEVVLGRSWG